MVVFTCNTCSAVLKRNKVINHRYQCRGCDSLSCIDCGKDFWGDDYNNHTQCISEEEKYGRKDAVKKINKGEAKQDQWIEQVQEAIKKSASKPRLKRLLESLQKYANIPRKKEKFENFMKNSVRCYDTDLVAACWDVLMACKNETKGDDKEESVNQNKSASLTNGSKKEVNEDDQADDEASSASKSKKERKEERRKKSQKKEKKDKMVETSTENASSDVTKKSKKRKRQELEDEGGQNVQNGNVGDEENKKKDKKKKRKNKGDESVKTEEDDECNKDNGLQEEEEAEEPPKKRKKTKFDWETVIKAVLEKKGELPLKKLKRKVLSEFANQDANNYNEDNLSAKFDKKVVKIKGVKVHKDRACLKE